MPGIEAQFGYPGEPPVGLMNFGLGDPHAATHAIVPLLGALWDRERTGCGCHIDMAQIEAMISALPEPAIEVLLGAELSLPPGDRSREQAPHGIFPAQGEDAWVSLTVSDDSQWQAFCALVGEPWCADPGFSTVSGRLARVDELEEHVVAWTRRWTREHLSRLRRPPPTLLPIQGRALMNVLIVHAHYEPRSFTCAMKDTAVETLRALDHDVAVSDLREMNFDPVAKKSDFLVPKRDDYTVYSLEQRHGWSTHTIAPDIATEVEKLLRADLLILNFPVFWFSVPAVMKGWIDRVFLSGVCFGGREFYDRGRLRGKRALVCATIGGREHMFDPQGIHGPIETMLQHLLRGTLGYVGMDVLPPYMAWHVPYIDDAARRQILEDYRGHLGRLERIEPLAMPSLADFDSVMRPLSPAKSISSNEVKPS